ncbi:MAG: GAF domain-containing protein [Candidatus Limnocylindrales bacterium]
MTIAGDEPTDRTHAVLEALGEINRTIAQPGFDLDQLLQTVIVHAVDLSRAEFGNILRFDEKAGYYRVIAYHGNVSPAYWELVTNFPYREDRGSMIGRTLIEKRPVHIVDVLEDPEYTAWEIREAAGNSYRTMLGIPMLRDDNVIGLFVLWRTEVEAFNESEISILSTFAAQATVAIDNLRLFQTVEKQRAEIARYAPEAAALLSSEGGEDMLAGHRREITTLFADLRGFTSFAESAEPEELLSVLREYQGAVGEVVVTKSGTVEHFAGDGLMAFFNDPNLQPDHQLVGVQAALEIRDRFNTLNQGWRRRGYELGLGIGLAVGFATIGRIGFEGRFDYGVVGNVAILASRLSDVAKSGEILLSQRLNAMVEDRIATEELPEATLKGITRPVPVFRVA